MQEPNGHVTVNERVPSHRFHRFVEEKVKDWMKENLNDELAQYEVAFFEEDVLGEVSCLVVIQAGDHLWRSWESADNSRLALSRSLSHLELQIEDGINETIKPQQLTH